MKLDEKQPLRLTTELNLPKEWEGARKRAEEVKEDSGLWWYDP